MKLSTSTGDFSGYVPTITEKIRNFKGSKFKYINLEQTGRPETLGFFFCDNEDEWKKEANDWGEAAAYAGVEFVVSHAPCLDAFDPINDRNYELTVRAIRRSLEACHMLGIKRTVIHASSNRGFTAAEYYKYNKKFYSEFFDLMEKYDITVMTENMPNGVYTPLSTGKEMAEFIEYIDHPLLAACWDTAHANLNEKSKKQGQYQSIIDLGDKLKGLHISDNFGDGAHHHSWPFAGLINFDAIMQGLIDVNYDGFFNFEASYTLLHQKNPPYSRKPWEHNGETVTKLLNPSVELKKKAVDLLYETGKYILETYDCYEE